MKLKEKLALEKTRGEVSCDESIRINDLSQRMYLAGFDKAREMAIERFEDGPSYAYDFLIKLGEEEVEDV